MKNIRLKYLLVIIFQLAGSISFAQNSIKQLADNLANSYLKENNNSGSIVIGMYENGKERLYYYGETTKGNNNKPDSNSLYELGSISETFTSILFADRTWKGVMHIDDKLQDYLPVNVPALVYQPVVCRPLDRQNDVDYGSREGKMAVTFTPYICTPDSSIKPQPVLLCYLASHTSGLPDLPDNLHSKDKTNPYADYNTDDLYDFLRKFRIENQVGFDYKHSSLGISILGKAISLKMKVPFEQALKECILDSLKMNDTRITLNENQKKKLVTGYTGKGLRANYWTADVLSPFIGLHSTPADMIKFLRTNIAISKNYYSDLLDYTHNPRLKPGGVLSEDLEIAMGWKIIPLKGSNNERKVVLQSGRTGGFASCIGFVETNHTGVFILSSVSKDVEGMAIQILDLLQTEKLQ